MIYAVVVPAHLLSVTFDSCAKLTEETFFHRLVSPLSKLSCIKLENLSASLVVGCQTQLGCQKSTTLTSNLPYFGIHIYICHILEMYKIGTHI